MNPIREQKIAIAGTFVAIFAIAFRYGESQTERSERHVAEAEAVLEAIAEIEGTPNAIANFGPLLFRTDKNGEVYALYRDGWKPVRP